MISIAQKPDYVQVMVADQFTLQDYQEFEHCVLDLLQSKKSIDILFDLREMQGYTVDVALEDIRFTRTHRNDLARIAVVTKDQWVLWSAWLNRMLADAEIKAFEEVEDAQAWIESNIEA
jgi:hypothetical protein